MHLLIENSRPQIAEFCRKYGVDRLEVFGSLLRDDFDIQGKSDVDVAVEFDPGFPGSPVRRYFDLKREMESLFGRTVDVVEIHALPESRLKRIIEKTKVPVYATATRGVPRTGTARVASDP